MRNTRNKILVADDDDEIRQILEILFTGEGYQVLTAKDGITAVEKCDDTVDLVILDVNMPGKSGFMAGAEIRKKSLVPLLFLTAYDQDSDKTIGYSAGADDYMTKPFSHSELLLKVKALLRRAQVYQPKLQADTMVINMDRLSVNLDTQSVSLDGKPVFLTHTEYEILALLIGHRKQIFSIEHIYNSIWQDQAVSDSAVMVHIKNIRKKIEEDPRKPRFIKTAWGKGYYID